MVFFFSRKVKNLSKWAKSEKDGSREHNKRECVLPSADCMRLLSHRAGVTHVTYVNAHVCIACSRALSLSGSIPYIHLTHSSHTYTLTLSPLHPSLPLNLLALLLLLCLSHSVSLFMCL
jgi:hypothetical protein